MTVAWKVTVPDVHAIESGKLETGFVPFWKGPGHSTSRRSCTRPRSSPGQTAVTVPPVSGNVLGVAVKSVTLGSWDVTKTVTWAFDVPAPVPLADKVEDELRLGTGRVGGKRDGLRHGAPRAIVVPRQPTHPRADGKDACHRPHHLAVRVTFPTGGRELGRARRERRDGQRAPASGAR